jgi:hypothetical protein
MKKRNNVSAVVVIAALIMAFGLTACGDGNNEGPGDKPSIIVPGDSFAEKLTWLKKNARDNTSYTIEVSANETIDSDSLFVFNFYSLTLIGIGEERIISLSSEAFGSLFTVGSYFDATLTLGNNITLRGHSSNNAALVDVRHKGTLIMNEGSKITGNTNTNINYDSSNSYADVHGGGVHVGAGAGGGGTFIMNGGEISGNTSAYGGSGVYMKTYSDRSGTFIMNGGKISGNSGSVVDMSPSGRGNIIMNDGEISGNDDNGVNVRYGTFTMNGGKISGNNGRGLSLFGNSEYMSGTFRISNGIIYGSSEGENSNASSLTCSYYYTAEYGTFSGETWNKVGNLSPIDDTIRVKDGVLQ